MAGLAGFDTAFYPGDSQMAWLKANTNLVWCGYYLAPAPSHRDTSWMGTRATLLAQGWGIAPVYLGQQTTGPGSHNVSPAQGPADSSDIFVCRCKWRRCPIHPHAIHGRQDS